MRRVRILGAVLFILGLWVFLAPFIGPAMHLYLSPPPMHMGMTHMGTGMMSNAVVINQAMVFFNFLPGLILIPLGIYLLFSGRNSPITPS
ncbi:MAG: hypothetical protein NVSMB27_33330 [Ktedonobacteraceae bacterium]